MTILLVAIACFVLNIKLVQPQSKDSLSPDAPISETIAWLKSHMPYTYTLPTASNGQVFRWTLGGLHSKDCKLKYDITIQSLDQANSSFDRQRFEVDLAGLNPEIIRIYPATKRDPVRIEFTSLNAKDPELIRQAQAHGGVVVAVKGKAIWQNHRQAEFVREGFVTHASFFTRNEERARELAAALKRGIELCRQNARSE
jgi:hypothetical protein